MLCYWLLQYTFFERFFFFFALCADLHVIVFAPFKKRCGILSGFHNSFFEIIIVLVTAIDFSVFSVKGEKSQCGSILVEFYGDCGLYLGSADSDIVAGLVRINDITRAWPLTLCWPTFDLCVAPPFCLQPLFYHDQYSRHHGLGWARFLSNLLR